MLDAAKGTLSRDGDPVNYWFVESAGPADPLLSMSERDWSDLPTWPPDSADE